VVLSVLQDSRQWRLSCIGHTNWLARADSVQWAAFVAVADMDTEGHSGTGALANARTPKQQYYALRDVGVLMEDLAQVRAMDALDDLHRRLSTRSGSSRLPLVRWIERWRNGREPETGIYLWGGVGRGKTLMVDLFYECLPFDARLRIHFHRFMLRVHRSLKRLAGSPDPLRRVADELAAEARVLCFDEFFVSDIGDAMILGELLDGLFERGVTLVATSNIDPERLYENGLQRRRFLPAIGLLKRHCQVIHVDGAVDYRLRVLERAEIYHSPLDAAAGDSLAQAFSDLVPDAGNVQRDVPLEIEGRSIPCRSCGDDVAWFDFADLCEGPRSQNDYIELARIYHAVLVSNVPVLRSGNEDAARRFISLVDEFYDRNVKLIVSAEAPVDQLYQGERLKFEFERARSRLLEMQSHDYLARSHRA
jgi:cell division protein ZapE